MTVRPAAVAGTFYPADRAALAEALSSSFAAARVVTVDRPPKAIVVPHAGYVYSGPVAATAYGLLEGHRGVISRVVLLGPSHRVAFRGLAVPSADHLDTPLGLVTVDGSLRDRVRGMPGVAVWDTPHTREHSLEVQLPFILSVLGDVSVLPIVVGDASPLNVAAVIDAVWGGDETLIVVSSDLSHYHPYDEAAVCDRATAAAVEDGRVGDIGPTDACGAFPLRGLLVAAGRRGLRARAVDLRSSGDTAGDRDRVVGYGAFVFEPAPASDGLAEGDRQRLLDLADAAVRAGLTGQASPVVDPASESPALRAARGVFVTVMVGDALNGCIGTVWADDPLCVAVPRLAWDAAFEDPRLPSLRLDDYPAVTIKISVLSEPALMDVAGEAELLAALRPGLDGLILAEGRRRATFLPAVWEKLPEPADFVAQLQAKAGLPPGRWSPGTVAHRYTASEFHRRVTPDHV